MISAPVSTLIMGSTAAPQVELYTTLACRVHRPDLPSIGAQAGRDLPNSFSTFQILVNDAIENALFKRMEMGQPNPCSSDPAVQATVAKLTTGT
jgi:hypothetical protein